MSWGFILDLKLSLADGDWEHIQALRPDDDALPAGWSGLKESELEAAFVRPVVAAELQPTFATAVAGYRAPHALATVESRRGVTRIRVGLFLDRGELGWARSAIALFFAAKEHAKSGSLRLVNDGTYAGEAGVELKLSRGAVSTKRLRDSVPVAEKLAAEIDGGTDDDGPARSASRELEIPPLPAWVAQIYPALLSVMNGAWELVHRTEDVSLMTAFADAVRRLPGHWRRQIEAKTAPTLRKRLLKAQSSLHVPHVDMLLRLAIHVDPARGERWLRELLSQGDAVACVRGTLELLAAQLVWSIEECFEILKKPTPTSDVDTGYDLACAVAGHPEIDAGKVIALAETLLAPVTDHTAVQARLQSLLVCCGVLLVRDRADAVQDLEARFTAAVASVEGGESWSRLVHRRLEELRLAHVHARI